MQTCRARWSDPCSPIPAAGTSWGPCSRSLQPAPTGSVHPIPAASLVLVDVGGLSGTNGFLDAISLLWQVIHRATAHLFCLLCLLCLLCFLSLLCHLCLRSLGWLPPLPPMPPPLPALPYLLAEHPLLAWALGWWLSIVVA